MFLPVIIIIGLFVGCKSNKNTQYKEQSQTIKDSVVVTLREQIHDTIKIQVPHFQIKDKNCDSLCNDKVQKYLSTIAFEQKRTHNSMGAYYDKDRKNLVLHQNIEQNAEVKEAFREKNYSQREIKIKEIVRYRVPLVYKILSGVGFCSILWWFSKIKI